MIMNDMIQEWVLTLKELSNILNQLDEILPFSKDTQELKDSIQYLQKETKIHLKLFELMK